MAVLRAELSASACWDRVSYSGQRVQVQSEHVRRRRLDPFVDVVRSVVSFVLSQMDADVLLLKYTMVSTFWAPENVMMKTQTRNSFSLT